MRACVHTHAHTDTEKVTPKYSSTCRLLNAFRYPEIT